MGDALFIAFSLLAVAGAVVVAVSRKPFNSLRGLLFVFLGTTSLSILWHCPLFFILSIIVFQAAILFIFLLGIKYINPKRDNTLQLSQNAIRHCIAIVAVWIISLLILRTLNTAFPLRLSFPLMSSHIPEKYFYWSHFIAIAMLALGFMGLLIRRNTLILLFSNILMLTAAIPIFIETSSRLQSSGGWVIALFIFALAFINIVIGLSLLVRLYGSQQSADVGGIEQLGG